MLVRSPAWTIDVDGATVVYESVEDGGCGDVVAEVCAPLVPLDVCGDYGGASVFISGGDDLVEESCVIGHARLPFGAIKADLVHDEKFASDEGLDGLLQVMGCEGKVQFGEHVGAGGVSNGVAVDTGQVTQSDGDVALTGSAHASEQDTLSSGKPIKRRQMHDLVAVDSALEIEVKGVESLVGWEARFPDPAIDSAFAPSYQLGFD